MVSVRICSDTKSSWEHTENCSHKSGKRWNCVCWLRRVNVTMLETKLRLNVWFRSKVHKLKDSAAEGSKVSVSSFFFPFYFLLPFFLYSQCCDLLLLRLCPSCCVRNVRSYWCACECALPLQLHVCLLVSVRYRLFYPNWDLYNVIVYIVIDLHSVVFFCVCKKRAERKTWEWER